LIASSNVRQGKRWLNKSETAARPAQPPKAPLTLGLVTGRLVAELVAGAEPLVEPAPFKAERFAARRISTSPALPLTTAGSVATSQAMSRSPA
jgi:hypothetical protein